MPIKPKPFVLECPRCHWKKVFSPKSDCLIKGIDYVDKCPVCSCSDLARRAPSTLELLLSKISN